MVSTCVCAVLGQQCWCTYMFRGLAVGRGVQWGAGGLIVMHLDGFRDSSFEKQGPH